MSVLSRLGNAARLFGIDFAKTGRSVRGLGPFLKNKRTFYQQYEADAAKSFAAGKLYPCLGDRYEEGGSASGHYFHQDLYVAQLIYDAQPQRHIDIGSRIDGFVSHVAVFRDIEVFDIRPLTTRAKNIHFCQLDLMEGYDAGLDNCTDSLSCLHALEHFGLGRYGDPIDYNGHQKGFRNLARMVKPQGRFYFSTPISKTQRFEFDGQRVFSLPYLLAMAEKEKLEVMSFAYVDDAGSLRIGVNWDSSEARQTYGLSYGCGILELRKRS